MSIKIKLHSTTNLFFRLLVLETLVVLFYLDSHSGKLAKVRRWIHRAYDCRRLDGIDTPGPRCPGYLCPQTIPDILLGWILPRCPCGFGQPKYYFVCFLSQIHAGQREGQPGLCIFGIPSVCGLDIHVVASRAVQKRCCYISHGHCWRRCERWTVDFGIMQRILFVLEPIEE